MVKKKKWRGDILKNCHPILFSCSYNARASGRNSFWCGTPTGAGAHAWSSGPHLPPEARRRSRGLAHRGWPITSATFSSRQCTFRTRGRSRHGSGHLLPYINFCQCGKVFGSAERQERQARALWVGLPGWKRGRAQARGAPSGGGAGASFQGQLYPGKSSSLEAAVVTLPEELLSCLLFSLSWSSKFFTLSSSFTLSDSRDWTTECKDLADAFSPLSAVTWNTWAGLGSGSAHRQAAGRLPQEGTLPHFSVFPARHPFLWVRH